MAWFHTGGLAFEGVFLLLRDGVSLELGGLGLNSGFGWGGLCF